MSAPRTNKVVHVGLFLTTCLSTFLACLVFFGGGTDGLLSDRIVGSALFSFVVMGILLAHELGHFLMARAHGVESSWPYFIPFPLGFGTLGAVIRLRGAIPTRNALVDIAAAGPLAGMLVCIPMMAVGVALSSVAPMPDDFTVPFPPAYSGFGMAVQLGDWLSHTLRGTALPPEPAGYQVFGDSVLSWILVRIFHGTLPAGSDLMAHPVFLAAWFGQLMTMLNLIPVGQLDGGHLTHAWFGSDAEKIGRRVATLTLVLAMALSISWLVWFFLATRVVGIKHPPVSRPEEPLTRSRKAVVVVCWVLTGLTFMPLPISVG